MPPIFVDTNIPVYAAGAEHPLRRPCLDVLTLVARHRQSFVTSVEVLQELIHRYIAIRRWVHGRGTFSRFSRLMVGRIESILVEDALLAATLADRYSGLAGRDLLHAATMRRLGLSQIVSTDGDFDELPGLERLDPLNVASWGSTVAG